jgi:hypothetical protein
MTVSRGPVSSCWVAVGVDLLAQKSTKRHKWSVSETKLTEGQQRMVKEIQRIASELGQKSLSENEFDKHHQLGGVTTAGHQFGSWNDAIKAAGLEPNPMGGSHQEKIYSDDELLQEIIRLHCEMGNSPSERRFSFRTRFSLRPYRDRWGTFAKAKEAAYERFKDQIPAG